MEIADFIHLSENEKCLTLMHVKAAKSKSPNRRMSVSPYEIVTAQAVKNLRHLDHELLSGNFAKRLDKRIKDAVWHNGRRANRAAMLTVLRRIRSDCVRRVIIFQPHVRRSALKAAHAPDASETVRLTARQLDTLLLGARADCQSLGAEFYVIGSKS